MSFECEIHTTNASSSAVSPFLNLSIEEITDTSPARNDMDQQSKMSSKATGTSTIIKSSIPSIILISPLKDRYNGKLATSPPTTRIVNKMTSLTTLRAHQQSANLNGGIHGTSSRRSASIDETDERNTRSRSPLINKQIGLDSPRRPERRMSNVDNNSCGQDVRETNKNPLCSKNESPRRPERWLSRNVNDHRTPVHPTNEAPEEKKVILARSLSVEGSLITSPTLCKNHTESPRRPERRMSCNVNVDEEHIPIHRDKNEIEKEHCTSRRSQIGIDFIPHNRASAQDEKNNASLICEVSIQKRNNKLIKRSISMDEGSYLGLQRTDVSGQRDNFFAGTKACNQSPRQPTRHPSVRHFTTLTKIANNQNKSSQRRYSCDNAQVMELSSTKRESSQLITSTSPRIKATPKLPCPRSPHTDESIGRKKLPSYPKNLNETASIACKQKRRSTMDMVQRDTPPLSPQRKINRSVHKNILERRHQRRYSNPDDTISCTFRPKHIPDTGDVPSPESGRYDSSSAVDADLCLYGGVDGHSPRRRKNNTRQVHQTVSKSTSLEPNGRRRSNDSSSTTKETQFFSDNLSDEGQNATSMENISGRMWLQSKLLTRSRNSFRNMFRHSNRILNVDDPVAPKQTILPSGPIIPGKKKHENKNMNNVDSTCQTNTIVTDGDSTTCYSNESIPIRNNMNPEPHLLHFLSNKNQDISYSTIQTNAALDNSLPSICLLKNTHDDKEENSILLFANDSLAMF